MKTLLTDSRYLRNTEKFTYLQPQKAQQTVSLSCVLYLQSSLDFVNSRVTEEEKRLNVALCLHELHPYAIDYWVDHLLALSKSLGSHLGGCDLEPLLQGLERLTAMHDKLAALQNFEGRKEGEVDCTREQRWQVFGISRDARSLLDKVLIYQQMASSDGSQPSMPHCKRAVLRNS